MPPDIAAAAAGLLRLFGAGSIVPWGSLLRLVPAHGTYFCANKSMQK
ncbi:MAG: hypothetical protein RRY53_08465 [Pseudoflavonifractor sp.]